jgi:hypothetical protein
VSTQVCVDKKRQWSKWRNVWHSAAIRSTVYTLGAPVRWARRQFPAIALADRDAVVRCRSGRGRAGALGIVAPRTPGGDHQCPEPDDRGGEPHDSADDGNDRQ